ncbi:dolichyl-P-Man:Man(5)GlcNAc(2)-PP-dolichol alpha-1,3-mannosyltransferase [Rhodotorula kratochvilovae]
MYGIPPPPPPPPPAEPSPAATPAQAPRKRTPPSSSRISELADDPPASKSTEPSLVAHLLDDPLALLTDHKRCFDLVAGLLLVWECVLYPALHIYAYAGLSWLTDGGKALQRAQWAFAGVYVATLAVVMFGIYRRNERIPPYALILLTLSKRLHSVYMLRMFNDALVMLLVYSAIALYMVPARGNSRSERKRVERRWMLGTVLLSCALSIKMSTLLFLPALFYLLFVHFSLLHLLQHLALLLLPLALLSTPFLSTPSHARTYASQAFHFTREFDFRYTLNWRFLGEEAFSRPGIATVFFLANLTGVLCARSLHPQFYAWFAWSLPWLVSGGAGMGAVEGWTGIALLLAIEYGMSVWPSTDNSSLGLVLAMLVLLVRSYYAEAEPARVGGAGKEDAWVVPPRWEEQGEGEGKEE